jgi:hypothetical protein
MWKKMALVVAGIVIGMAGAVAAPLWRDRLLPQSGSSHAGPTIEQVQSLSSLVTSRVEVSDVVVTKLSGYTGGIEAAVLLRGDFELGVDLSAAKFESMDQSAHTAVLVLPQPQASQPRVDHRRSRIVAIREQGLWKFVPGNDAELAVTNLALRDTQQFVADAAAEPALIERARHQAEQVLGSFFKAVGWTVTVRWRE